TPDISPPSLHDALPIFRPVLLPGGDAAVKQIGRTGLALAWDAGVSPAVLDALPLLRALPGRAALLAMLEKGLACPAASSIGRLRSEEHTSELQSRFDLV